MDFQSGYVQRSLHLLPKQGDRAPWRLRQNYLRDALMIRRGGVAGRRAPLLAGAGTGGGARMSGIAQTPEPPYVAVVFTSLRTEGDEGYGVMSDRMNVLAAEQPGYLGRESCRDPDGITGITVSYWVDEDAARAWKQVAEHLVAQQRGKDAWYSDYRVRVASVLREYGPGGVSA